MLVEYKIVTDYPDFIRYLRESVPICDPDHNIDVAARTIEKVHHIIVHKEIYAKIKMDYYSYMQLSDMMFTVSLLSKDIASVIKDKIVVTGDELEMYLHQTSDTKNIYVFDGTRFSGMHTHGFHKQVPLMSQKSRFDLSSQTGYNESYQLEESNGYGKQDPPKENMFTLM